MKSEKKTIRNFLQENPWKGEKTEWGTKIDEIYERIDWFLLYKIDCGTESISGLKDKDFQERLELLLKTRRNFLKIYKTIQEKEGVMGSQKKQDRWLEKMKGLLGFSDEMHFDLGCFFETPKEERAREKKKENGEDFKGRILEELNIMNDVRLNFSWKDIPEEILINLGETVEKAFFSLMGFKRDSKGKIILK